MAPWGNVSFLVWGRKYKMNLEDVVMRENQELLKSGGKKKKNKACQKDIEVNLKELPVAKAGK